MKLHFVILLFLIFSSGLYAQDFSEIDYKVKHYPKSLNTIESLALRISNDFITDEEKVRAAFTWVSHNINYKTGKFFAFSTPEIIIYNSKYELKKRKEEVIQRRIQRILDTKIAVCDGYALVFKALCDHLNIECEVIKGISKQEIKAEIGSKVYKNHSWNVVFVNQEWKLIDTTWSAGYVNSKEDVFVSDFDDTYFFTKPTDFIKHHYPKYDKWQLIPQKISLKDFFKAPIFYDQYFETAMQLSEQHSGILTITEDKSVRLYFDAIPEDTKKLIYTIADGKISKKLAIYKDITKGKYYAVFPKISKKYHNQPLVLFYGGFPMIEFKIRHTETIN